MTPEEAFESWWFNEGSGMPPLPGEDAEAHVHRIARIAWVNGAFTADESVDGPTAAQCERN